MSDRVTGAFLIVVSVIFVVMAFGIQPGFFSDPLGARFVPIAIGVFLAGASLVLLIKPQSAAHWPSAPIWFRLVLCLAVFVGYGLLLNPLGFILSTTLAFTSFAMLFQGKPFASLLAGVIFSVASYLLFSTALDLFLPTGRIFQGWF